MSGLLCFLQTLRLVLTALWSMTRTGGICDAACVDLTLLSPKPQ